MKRTAFRGLLVVLLGAGLLAAGGAVSAASTADAGAATSTNSAAASGITAASTSDEVVVNVTRKYHPTPNDPENATMELIFDDPDVEAGMEFNPGYDQEVLPAQSTRFEAGEHGDWVVTAGSQTPVLTLRWNVSEATDVADRHGAWHFFNHPYAPSSDYRSDAPDVEYEYTNVAAEGIVWRDHAFVGQYDKTTRYRDDGGEIVVGVPEGVETDVPPNRIADYLKGMDSELDSGGKAKTVTVMASGGGYAIGQTDRRLVTVWPDSAIYGVINAWGHECHHATEEVRLAGNMSWFTEGYAVYATQTYSLNTGHGGWQQQAQVNTRVENTEGTLVNSSSWDNGIVYDRGGLVLQALDRRLRQDTNGAATMEDVLQRMHAHEGEVNKSDFLGFLWDEGANSATVVDANTWLTEDTNPPYQHWTRSNTQDVYNRDLAEFDVSVTNVTFPGYAQTPRDDGDQHVAVEAGQTVSWEVQVTNVGDRTAWVYPMLEQDYERVDAEARQVSPGETVTVELSYQYDQVGTKYPNVGPFAHREDWTVDVVDPNRVPYGPTAGTPTDPDGDRLFEDVNGNGQMDTDDVNELYNHRNETAMQDDAWAYDFDQDGDLDGDDVDALFEEV